VGAVARASDHADQRKPPVAARSEGAQILESEMEKFLFGDGSAAPAGYVPPEA
jgi:Fe-S cluster biosynthesis and repair protein YggX